MASTNVSETVSREASDIEERKVGLMDSAKAQIDAANLAALEGQFLNPDFEVASLSPDQLNALDLGRQGIGAYLPYMKNATNQYQMAGNNAQQAVNTLLGADTRNQFTAAQEALNRSATPIANLGQSAQLATQYGMLLPFEMRLAHMTKFASRQVPALTPLPMFLPQWAT